MVMLDGSSIRAARTCAACRGRAATRGIDALDVLPVPPATRSDCPKCLPLVASQHRQQVVGATQPALLIVTAIALLIANPSAHAGQFVPKGLEGVGFDQRLNEQVPLELEFADETGRPIRLGDYFASRPAVLVLAYYQCPMLCTQVLNNLVLALKQVSFTPGRDFDVVIVSFDAREKPDIAAAKKRAYTRHYDRPGSEEGWHFLTGRSDAIESLSKAVGFRFVYDPKRDQFAHASGIMLLAPGGKIARYFYDVNYRPRDLRLGLVEASAGKIGSPVDQVMLYCFHYDPAAGKYGAAIMNLVRLGGVLTMIVLGVFLTILFRHDRDGRSAAETRGAIPTLHAHAVSEATWREGHDVG